MNKFNLTEKSWIPCAMTDGIFKELNLLDTLTQAHKIREITDDSPLVVVSLHRFLLAVLHRNFGPKNFDEWKNLWRKGFWDSEKLKSYFEKWSDRFNLFDDERPFYQYPKVTKKGGVDSDKLPIETLMQEKATGANATLFDHSFKSREESCSPPVAARYLIARHSFSLAGGVSSPFNLSNGLLVKGFSILAIGDNLFQTLALNLVTYYRDKPMPVEDDDGVSLDKPFWERETLDEATENNRDGTTPLGYLDYLTWQSRRIKLLPENDFQSIKFCRLQQNFKLKRDLNIFDPFKVYMEGDEGFYALNFNRNKSLWRNSHTIFKQKNSPDEISSLFKHLTEISAAISASEIIGKREYPFAMIGIITEANKQASVETWMRETLPIPLDYFDDNNLTETLETAIQFAEEISEKLRAGVKKLADLLQTNVANFQAMPIYWSTLELKFQRLLSNLPDEKEAAMREWFGEVLAVADDAFNQTANSLSGSAEELKGAVEARRLYGALRYKTKEASNFKNYLPETKTTGGTQ